jgi:hypothetical protein
MKLGLLMNSDTLICIWILVFPIGIIEFSTNVNDVFILFQFLTRLLNSNHLILLITYLVERNGAMWEMCFSAPQIAKKENQLKHKNPSSYWSFYWEVGLQVWRFVLVIKTWAHKSQKFTLISIKMLRIWKFFFTRNRVCKHKEVVSKLHVCTNDLRKMCALYIFHFSTKILTPAH